MVRRWWLLLALAAVFMAPAVSVVPVAAAPARDVNWGTLPYYYYNSEGQFFNVPTNAETFEARRITNVNTGFSSDYRTPEQYGGKVLEAVWDKTCPAVGKQKVIESRRST